jgi:glc operon protein GlcG
MSRTAPTRTVAAAALALTAGSLLLFAQAPPAAGPPPPPNEVSLSDALTIIDEAGKTAKAMGINAAIAVTDARGDIIAVERLPGASPATPDDAVGTAVVAAIYGLPSGLSLNRATNAATIALNESMGGRMRVVQGSVTILSNGFVIGAVGAAGGTAQQNEDISNSGLKALGGTQVAPAQGGEAAAALTAALGAASKMGVRVACAVVDVRGDLLALRRMDQARFHTPDVARAKAVTSAIFGQPSGNVAQMARSPLFDKLNASAQGRLSPMPGGVPVMRDQKLYGAIGCSGATAQQDEDAAKAGSSTF